MTFLEEVKALLSQAQHKPVAIPKEILKQFLKDCKQAVEKQFTQKRESEFRIRMSSIGKPLCQLQMEKKYSGGNAIQSYENYNNKLRFLFGDLLEAVVIMLLRTTKANIQGVNDFNFFNYNTNQHRHICEIRQELEKKHNKEVLFSFNPHILPNFRGMMSTIYCDLNVGVNQKDVIKCFDQLDSQNYFVDFKNDELRADFFLVQNTNKCVLKIFKHYDDSKIIIISLIDNLLKGAAGQAVQCFNLSKGFDESSGLI